MAGVTSQDPRAAGGPNSSVRSSRTGDPDYQIRHTDRNDEPRILELLRQTVGETTGSEKTTDFWRWKHSRSTFGPSYSVCAWEGHPANIVGLRTLMWWSLRGPEDTIHRAVRAVDTATHPDHQRRGIFSRLTRFAIDDLRKRDAAFIFNTPNDSSLPGYLKMGWRTVARWPLYVRPVGWLATAAKLVGSVGAGDARRPQGGIDDSGLMTWGEFRAATPSDFGEIVARNEKLRPTVGYRTMRSPEFLDWRYGEHPGVEYLVHPLERNGLEAFVVARAVAGARGLKALVVTDVFLRDPSPQHAAALFRSLLAATTCDYVMAHFPRGTVEHRALMRCGFLRAPRRGYTFAVRPLRSLTTDPTRADVWDLTLSELEIF